VNNIYIIRMNKLYINFTKNCVNMTILHGWLSTLVGQYQYHIDC
jgi:hypothetical protein